MYPVLMAVDTTMGTDYQTVLTSLTTAFSEANIASILAYGISAVAGIALFWFAVRKVGGMFLRAVRKGKIRI